MALTLTQHLASKLAPPAHLLQGTSKPIISFCATLGYARPFSFQGGCRSPSPLSSNFLPSQRQLLSSPLHCQPAGQGCFSTPSTRCVSHAGQQCLTHFQPSQQGQQTAAGALAVRQSARFPSHCGGQMGIHSLRVQRAQAISSEEEGGGSIATASPLSSAPEEAAAAPAPASEQPQRDGSEGTAAAPPGPAVRKRIVSGVQPTGSIHLGNYLGAIKNWVALQDQCDTLYFVVDLHAITLPHDPQELAASTKKSAAIYLACGVDPSKASIFVQSHVRAHAELTWLLSCATPISWLNRMIQFKEKSRKAGEDVGTGLLTYPLLMASDILLYQCDVVPVGEDQRQHLELTRDVAARINNIYGGKKRGGRVFKVPEMMIPPAGARVMSLTDGTAKMSKSAPSDLSRINLLDTPDEIRNKVKRCKTDSFLGMEFDHPERPECHNLLSIYQLVSSKSKEEVAAEVRDLSWGAFKPLLADALVAHLEPVQKRYQDVVADPAYVDSILAQGAERANEIADKTLKDVYDALGFLPPTRLRL
eukprot:jgi/Mesen1/7299/ME000374S06661